jgi:predicted N-acetyltransferase YhbS
MSCYTTVGGGCNLAMNLFRRSAQYAQYQKQGIGKAMIEITKEAIGEEVALILLAAPKAMDYYPKVGFEKLENGFIIKRKQ